MAPQWLAELEKPFQDFYAAYEDYLRRLAEWQSRFGATVTVIVSPTPLPPPPKPPGEAPPPGWQPSYSSALEATAPPPGDTAGAAPSSSATVQPLPGATGMSVPSTATVQPLPPSASDAPVGPPAPSSPTPDDGAPRLEVQPIPPQGD